LRNLIDAGHIAPGVVDERSIEDVFPDDLRGFTQCHFFAGIGVWSYALRQAGWDDSRPVWTGSCPCQPFSTTGKKFGFTDERHLWPAWQHLIGQCLPSVVLGEQVAGAIEWLDLVHRDMEGMDYAFGCSPLEAACTDAPHLRDRLFFVAHPAGQRSRNRSRLSEMREKVSTHGDRPRRRRFIPWLCTDGRNRPIEPGLEPVVDGSAERVGLFRAYGNAINAEAARVFIEAYMTTNTEQP